MLERDEAAFMVDDGRPAADELHAAVSRAQGVLSVLNDNTPQTTEFRRLLSAVSHIMSLNDTVTVAQVG